ncbi:MAG: hypothetical protein IIW58_08830 [Bacteroidales bacterium]|nr:hypothetical protein [Bacteroidales bacterium]
MAEKIEKVYGFQIGQHIIDIDSDNEKEAFKLLIENYWDLISEYEKVELIGQCTKVTELPYQNDIGIELLAKKEDDKIYILKQTPIY